MELLFEPDFEVAQNAERDGATQDPGEKRGEGPIEASFQLLGMIGMIWHDIMPNGFCIWHDGGMTGSMTVRLSCHSQADT